MNNNQGFWQGVLLQDCTIQSNPTTQVQLSRSSCKINQTLNSSALVWALVPLLLTHCNQVTTKLPNLQKQNIVRSDCQKNIMVMFKYTAILLILNFSAKLIKWLRKDSKLNNSYKEFMNFIIDWTKNYILLAHWEPFLFLKRLPNTPQLMFSTTQFIPHIQHNFNFLP